MRGFTLVMCAVALAGCSKKEQPVTDTAMGAAMAPAPAPAAIALADVAGKWTVVVKPETGDSTLVTYELNATGDASGWTLVLPGQKPVAVRVVEVSGDSIVTEAGPYPSVLRKGAMVSTHTVSRLKDGRLVGTSTAHYSKGADSVMRVRTEATRK
jgi:hypothetical protein